MSKATRATRAFWNTSAVLVWIGTRDLDAVESASLSDSLLHATVTLAYWQNENGQADLVWLSPAIAELQSFCREGRIVASGILNRWGEEGQPFDRRPIPAEAWCERGAALQERRGELELWFTPRSEGDHWTALLFKGTAVQACWPASKAILTIAVEKRAGQWLAAEVAKGPPTKPKADYEAELKGLYSIGHRAFLRVWDAATSVPGAEAWRKSGPKPKKPDNSNQ